MDARGSQREEQIDGTERALYIPSLLVFVTAIMQIAQPKCTDRSLIVTLVPLIERHLESVAAMGDVCPLHVPSATSHFSRTLSERQYEAVVRSVSVFLCSPLMWRLLMSLIRLMSAESQKPYEYSKRAWRKYLSHCKNSTGDSYRNSPGDFVWQGDALTASTVEIEEPEIRHW